MALSPKEFIDPAELPPGDRIAKVTSVIENEVDRALKNREFDRFGSVRTVTYEWPQLKTQMKKAKHGVSYVITMSRYRTDLSDYEMNEVRAAYRRLRRMYQAKGWKNIIFNAEIGVLYDVALIKEG